MGQVDGRRGALRWRVRCSADVPTGESVGVSGGPIGYPRRMDTIGMELALARGHVIGLFPFVAGLVVVAGLIAAVWWGRRMRTRQPRPPRPEEQPRLPESGPVHEIREKREPHEVPRSGERLTPHQLPGQGTSGSRRADDQEPDTWTEGGSGAFGSGGPGRT